MGKVGEGMPEEPEYVCTITEVAIRRNTLVRQGLHLHCLTHRLFWSGGLYLLGSHAFPQDGQEHRHRHSLSTALRHRPIRITHEPDTDVFNPPFTHSYPHSSLKS